LILRSEGQPVETPLVEKLVVKSPQVAETHQNSPQLPADGQLSPGGNFRYSIARDIYIPVDKGNVRYTENGHAPTAEHLIREHGHARSSAEKWTQAEREIAHANDHAAMSQRVTRSSNVSQETVFRNTCPSGQCGNGNIRVGIFGRRR
jgi:hypothetical protein